MKNGEPYRTPLERSLLKDVRELEAERDRLRKACEKVEAWLRRLSERAAQQADTTEWPSMIDTYRADAKNYGAVAKDLRAALETSP